jgi:cytochrome c-type biogenesis protein CcmH/NrfF
MSAKFKISVIVIGVALLFQVLTATAFALDVNDVASEFICNCGCNQMLPACEMDCGKKIRSDIKNKIQSGMDKGQIIQYMKTTYSEDILAAPERSGFNWVAWITPFAVVIIGGVAIERTIRRWTGRRNSGADGDDDENAGVGQDGVDKKYGDRIKAELKEFGW